MILMSPLSIVYLFITLIFSSCASTGAGLHAQDLAQLRYGQSLQEVEAITGRNPGLQIDYKLNSDIYRYETYYVGDRYSYFEALYLNGHLESLAKLTSEQVYSFRNAQCTSFPPYLDTDTGDCLRKFTNEVLARKAQNITDVFSVKDEKYAAKIKEEKDKELGTAIVYAPILIPAIILVPVSNALADKDMEKKRREFKVSLGDKIQDIKDFINALPPKAKVIENGRGSLYVPSGMFASTAVGLEDGEVNWILRTPSSVGSESISTGVFGRGVIIGSKRIKENSEQFRQRYQRN